MRLKIWIPNGLNLATRRKWKSGGEMRLNEIHDLIFLIEQWNENKQMLLSTIAHRRFDSNEEDGTKERSSFARVHKCQAEQ